MASVNLVVLVVFIVIGALAAAVGVFALVWSAQRTDDAGPTLRRRPRQPGRAPSPPAVVPLVSEAVPDPQPTDPQPTDTEPTRRVGSGEAAGQNSPGELRDETPEDDESELEEPDDESELEEPDDESELDVSDDESELEEAADGESAPEGPDESELEEPEDEDPPV